MEKFLKMREKLRKIKKSTRRIRKVIENDVNVTTINGITVIDTWYHFTGYFRMSLWNFAHTSSKLGSYTEFVY